MPIYEYQCNNCGHTLDALQKISDSPLRKCPECQRQKLKRLMSAPKFRLKGAGWYETDFKTDNKRNLADDGNAPKEAKADAKADTKADAPKEAKAETPKKEKAASKSGADGGKAA